MAQDIIARGLAANALKKIADMPNGFVNKGEVSVYADLPSSSNKVGDLYTVRTATEGHPAGRYVWGMSNGTLKWYQYDGENSYATKAELTSVESSLTTKINNKSKVTVSATGTATDEIKYINVDGVEKKISGGEPAAYIKSVEFGDNSNITFKKKDNTTQVYQPAKYIELSFYNDGDTGTLTTDQVNTLKASELNYVWLNGMHRLDFKYKDDNNNKATYSAMDTSSDGNKTHSIEVNLTTKEFKVYHKTLQEKLTGGNGISINNNTVKVVAADRSVSVGEFGVRTVVNTTSLEVGDNGIAVKMADDSIVTFNDGQGTKGIKVNTNKIQPKLTAGQNITISADNVISATGGGSGAVSSVNGRTGAIVLSKSDVNLDNVDNTSDLNKPISTATQTALDNKQDKLTAGDNIEITNNVIKALSQKIGKNFTTDIAVGHLGIGTQITSDMTLADILYAILYKEDPAGKMYIYYGGAGSENALSDPSAADLPNMTKLEITDSTTQLVGTHTWHFVTGKSDGDSQYCAFVVPNAFKVTKWTDSSGSFSYPLSKISIAGGYDIWYYNSYSYDYPEGNNHLITVAEV